MNTCKAALRILHARKLYVIIYLVWIGAMMLGISWQIMHASRNADSTTYQPSAAQVAIIDRDADADGLASSLRSYLSTDSEIVDIADDDESLQQAVASNYVDLIAIIPKGFAERYQRYLNEADGSAAQYVDTENYMKTTNSYQLMWKAPDKIMQSRGAKD